jgi:hypothetical protein
MKLHNEFKSLKADPLLDTLSYAEQDQVDFALLIVSSHWDRFNDGLTYDFAEDEKDWSFDVTKTTHILTEEENAKKRNRSTQLDKSIKREENFPKKMLLETPSLLYARGLSKHERLTLEKWHAEEVEEVITDLRNLEERGLEYHEKGYVPSPMLKGINENEMDSRLVQAIRDIKSTSAPVISGDISRSPIERLDVNCRNPKAINEAHQRFADDVLYIAPLVESKFRCVSHVYSALGGVHEDYTPEETAKRIVLLNNHINKRIVRKTTEALNKMNWNELIIIPAKEGYQLSKVQKIYIKKFLKIEGLYHGHWKHNVHTFSKKPYRKSTVESDWDISNIPDYCRGVAEDNKLKGMEPYLVGPDFTEFALLKGKKFVISRFNHSYPLAKIYHEEGEVVMGYKPVTNEKGEVSFKGYGTDRVVYYPKA